MTEHPLAEKSIFLAAIEIGSATERAVFLEQACAGNPSLRSEIEALLQAHGSPQRLLDAPVAGVPTVAEPQLLECPGTMIGPYKLLEQIGEGGFGVVFMAEQTQPVRRKVALKVLKPGMDTRQVVARFEAERQALALMDHPNIAHILDGGETASGRPYFVMELVRGIPITEFCDQNQLNVRERLELFVSVCQAVQHAHQKGIIHRDLKPSNVLVTLHDDKAVPKIIDFGIAKATGQQLTDKTLFTGFAQMVGTPLYMSPEQAQMSGLDVDTRSDIYALGVLLYELLTGTTPFDKERLRTVGYDEIRRIIREEEPPRPSTRISTLGQAATTLSTQRQSDPKRLSQLFRGELDWIVMKCLEKDRNRRYETANGLALDIQRYLTDEPVLACPPSAGYRFRKFARRNRAVLVTSTLVTTALAVAAVTLAISYVRIKQETKQKDEALILAQANEQAANEQRRKAEEHLRIAHQAVDDMYTDVADKWLSAGDLEPLQRQFLEKALKYYEAFAQETGAEPAIRVQIAQACRRVASIRHKLDRYAEAAQALAQAVSIVEKLVSDFPKEPAYSLELAEVYKFWSYALSDAHRGDPQVLVVGRKAVQVMEALTREHPNEPSYQLAIAIRQADLANVLALAGHTDDAEKSYLVAQRYLEGNATRRGMGENDLDALCRCYTGMGNLLKGKGSVREAEQQFRKGIELYEKKIVGTPEEARHSQNWADLYWWFGVFLRANDCPQEAAQAYRKAVDLYEARASRWPDLRYDRRQLNLVYRNLADLHAAAGEAAEAEKVHRRAVEFREKILAELHHAPDWRLDLAADYVHLASLLRVGGQSTKAASASRRAVDLYSAVIAQTADKARLAEVYVRRGESYYETKAFDKALADYQNAAELQPDKAEHQARLFAIRAHCPDAQLHDLGRAIEHARKATEYEPMNPNHHACLSFAFRAQGKLRAARDAAQKALELDPAHSMANCEMAALCLAEGNVDRALAFAQKAVKTGPNSADSYWLRGDIHARLGRQEEALADYNNALRFAPGSSYLHKARAVANYRLRHYDRALADVAKAIELNPHDTHAVLCLLPFLNEHSEEALARGLVALATKLIERRPADPWPYAARAVLYLSFKQPEKAAPDIEKAIKLGLKDAAVFNNWAWYVIRFPSRDADSVRRALTWAQKAVALAPTTAANWNTLGVAFYRTGQCKEAISALEKSIELEQYVGSYNGFFLALSHWQLGNKAEARRWYDAAVEWMKKHKPNDEELRRFRAEAAELLGRKETKH
jgi:serine/threonine protein kinase/Flp pilus assembly protein TadD